MRDKLLIIHRKTGPMLSLVIALIMALLITILHTQFFTYIFSYRALHIPYDNPFAWVLGVVIAFAARAGQFGAVLNGVNNFNDDRPGNGIGQALLLVIIQVVDALVSWLSITLVEGLAFQKKAKILSADFDPSLYDIDLISAFPLVAAIGAMSVYMWFSQWSLVLTETKAVTGSSYKVPPSLKGYMSSPKHQSSDRQKGPDNSTPHRFNEPKSTGGKPLGGNIEHHDK